MEILLSIDYGKKFTGLALFNKDSDPYPLPYDRIAYQNDHHLVQAILQVAQMESVTDLIVGVPRLLDGKETNMTKEVQNFVQVLEKASVIKVHQQDETLSTYEAKKRMESSARYNFQIDMKQVDALAACIILEDFLSSH
jgi:putative Holliday junction resolvase